MTHRVRKNSRAELDIMEIWSFISADNIDAADRWLEKLDELLSLLSTSPYMGRLRPELLPELRSIPMGAYVIFYQVGPGQVMIVRIIHGSRDIESQFDN